MYGFSAHWKLNASCPGFGAEVATVTPDSAADKAGLKSGDVITNLGLLIAVLSHGGAQQAQTNGESRGDGDRGSL